MGSGCTLATEPAAEASHFWNISQVSKRDRLVMTTSSFVICYDKAAVCSFVICYDKAAVCSFVICTIAN